MTHTITGTFDTIVTLNSAIYDPTTITSSGRLNDGIQISFAGLTLLNAGGVSSATGFGVDLLAGGQVTNQTGGSIAGEFGLVGENAAVTVVNAGAISAYYNYMFEGTSGIDLRAGGSVTNQSSGSISGRFGITGQNAAVTVVNAGSIQGGFFGAGVNLQGGGNVDNQSGGRIEAHQAIDSGAAPITVVNAGVIISQIGEGIRLNGGGSVTNLSGGTISGDFQAIVGGTMTVVNAGIIDGGFEHGLWLGGGGTVTNESGGSINGRYAINDYGALTVVNAGAIDGSAGYALRFAAGFTNRLIVEPTAEFKGPVLGNSTVGDSAVSTLELAGTSPGKLSGIGTQFTGFPQTTIDAGASWTLADVASFDPGTTLANSGALLLGSTFTDLGLVENDGSIGIGAAIATLQDLTGTGTVEVSGGGTLTVLGTVAAGETIVFGTGGGLLAINPDGFSGRIDGFTIGDGIELTGVSDGLTPAIVNGNTLEIQRTGHSAVDLTLDPAVDYTGNVYAITAEGLVTEPPCFLRGTLIRTNRGEVAVQDLIVGECVLTLSGELRPIIWIGSGQAAVSPGKRTAATPVIVRRGALGNNVPFDDLRITKGHELFVDGVLIPAEFLINHRSILWDDHQRTVEYYYIELATHDVLIANGAAAESYRDDGNRWLFRNTNDGWDATPKTPCAPVLTGGPIVDAIWRRLLDRAGPRPGIPLTGDPDLHLLIDGNRLEATTRTRDVHVFDLPRTLASARVVSRAAAPRELGLAPDSRSLGVALRRIVVRQMTRFRVIEAGDSRLERGFHAFEHATGLRWTDGDATLPGEVIGGFDGPVELVLQLGCATRYPAFSLALALAAA